MCWLLIISVLFLGYTYVGYPVLMGLLARWGGRKVDKGSFNSGVSILIVAHNEVDTLPRKLKSLLERAKDEPIREICLGLDGCTDGTLAAVRKLLTQEGILLEEPSSGLRICMREFAEQRGKASVLNALMKEAGQPIWVMMDARQRLEVGAIDRLLENFSDPQVGVVSGALIYESAEGGAQKGADSYWVYEKHLRLCESQFWAVPGATGALYAIRKELCYPIPENTLVDDVLIPMRAVMKGFRCLFEPSARVFDVPSAHFDQENIRKRRTLAGIWQLLCIEPKIFSVLANPIWLQWISHKFLRLLTPFICMIFYISVCVLAWGGAVGWKYLFLATSLGILGSFFAYFMGRKSSSRWVGVLGAGFGVNISLILAAADACSGRFDSRWKS